MCDEADPLVVRDLAHEVGLSLGKSMDRVQEINELAGAWVIGPKSHAKQVT